MANDPFNDEIEFLSPKATLKGAKEEEPKKVRQQGFGVFGDLEEAGDGVDELQSVHDKSVYREMAGGNVVIDGLTLRPVSLTTFACLQEVGSAFVTFQPILTPDERNEYQKLRRRWELSQGNKRVSMSASQSKRLGDLHASVTKENAQVGNPYMETLIFLALQDARTTPEQAETLAFGPRADLRSAALRVGEKVNPDSFDDIGKQIAHLIADAQKTKVRPVTDPKHASEGN
jgi:hypothetical protein